MSRTNPPSFARKMSWFAKGTTHQSARPVSPVVQEDKIAGEVQEEVVQQFEAARDGTRLKLDLRRRFRALGKQIAKGVAAQILTAPGKVRPDGKPTGGSLARQILRVVKVRRDSLRLAAGSAAGLAVRLDGIKLAELRLREIATVALRATKSAAGMVRELEDLRDRARELEAVARGRS